MLRRLSLIVPLLFVINCFPYVYHQQDRVLVRGIDVDATLEIARLELEEGGFDATLTVWAPIQDEQREEVMTAPIEVCNEIAIPAAAERVWDLLTDVERWPSWWRACRWVRVESPGSAAEPLVFRWKAHPVELRSAVVTNERPRSFAITADGLGVHAERAFTLRPTPDGSSTVVVSHETQVGPLPWLGRAYLGPRLHAVNQAMFDDLARAVAPTSR